MQLLQHFKDLTVNPKNTKDLKGLILQLAIQGNLTENWRQQNPNVESSSQLLKDIRQEKKKLIKEKKVRKTSIDIIIDDDEKYLDVPNNWEWARIIEVGNLYNGNSVNKEVKEIKYSSVKEGYPYLGTKDVNHGFEELEYENGIKIPFDETIFKIAHKNTPLICSEGGSAGKKCGITKQDICFGNKLYALELYGNIEPIFILSLYQTPVFFNEFQERMTGIIGGISINSFGEIPIPLPPIEEQKEIVRVVEILFKEVEQLEQLTKERIALKEDFVTSALRELTTANTETEWNYLQNHFKSFFTEKSSIKKLREAVLQLAVQGKLTVDWRRSNPNTENASELLIRIKEEKEKLIAEKKNKKENLLAPINPKEMPYKLADKWEWAKIGDYYDVVRGSSPRPKADPKYWTFKEDGHHWITIADFTPYDKNGFLVDTKSFLSDIGMNYSREVSQSDILIACSGVGSVGRSIKLGIEGFIYDGIIAIRKITDDTIRDFISLFIKYKESEIYSLTTGGGWLNINTDLVKNYIIAIPPLEEQKAIVEKVNALMLLCDQLEKEIDESKNLNEQLMKSVLREVFESKNEKEHV